MGRCLACGVELPPLRSRGNPRKWCSEACRQWGRRHPGEQRRWPGCCACGARIYTDDSECSRCRMSTQPPRVFSCSQCGSPFTTAHPLYRYCSARCQRKAARQRRKAAGTIRQEPWGDRRRDRYHRRRARAVGAPVGRPVLASEIFERDSWVCHVCGEGVDRGACWPDQLSASLDHVIPLSAGGAHDPSNVRLAHVACNAARARLAA